MTTKLRQSLQGPVASGNSAPESSILYMACTVRGYLFISPGCGGVRGSLPLPSRKLNTPLLYFELTDGGILQGGRHAQAPSLTGSACPATAEAEAGASRVVAQRCQFEEIVRPLGTRCQGVLHNTQRSSPGTSVCRTSSDTDGDVCLPSGSAGIQVGPGGYSLASSLGADADLVRIQRWPRFCVLRWPRFSFPRSTLLCTPIQQMNSSSGSAGRNS